MADVKVQMTMQSDQITPHDQHLLVHLPNGELSIAARIPPMPRSHLICYNCRSMLEFIAGPQQVKCSRCQAVNKVPPPKVGKEKCQNCRVMLQFPIGSKKVKCGACKYVN